MDVVDPGCFVRLQMFDSRLDLPLVKSPERLASALVALRRSYTSPMIFLVKALSASGNLPLLISCAAMVLAVMGYGVVLEAWPVSLLMDCHARRMEWVKSIDSTVSVHLSLSVWC